MQLINNALYIMIVCENMTRFMSWFISWLHISMITSYLIFSDNTWSSLIIWNTWCNFHSALHTKIIETWHDRIRVSHMLWNCISPVYARVLPRTYHKNKVVHFNLKIIRRKWIISIQQHTFSQNISIVSVSEESSKASSSYSYSI